MQKRSICSTQKTERNQISREKKKAKTIRLLEMTVLIASKWKINQL